ncbi:MAG: hypothetical protein JSV03_09320, partial [Planctomycetota bacterium]
MVKQKRERCCFGEDTVMEDKDKTRDELVRELSELRGRVAQLEQLEATHSDTEQQLRRQREVVDGINRVLRESLTLEDEAEIAGT